MLARHPGVGGRSSGDSSACLGGVHCDRAHDSAPPRNHHQIPPPETTANTVANAATINGQRRRRTVGAGGAGGEMYTPSVLFVWVAGGEDLGFIGECGLDSR